MKLVGVFLLVIVAIISTTEASLKDDINDLAKLVPKAKIIAIAGKHMLFDKEFKKFRKFIKSSECDNVKNQLLAHPKVLAAVDYLNKKGANINLNKKLNMNLNLNLNLDDFDMENDFIQPRSVKSFVEEVFRALPKSKLSAAMKQKMQPNSEFKMAVDAASTDEFKNLINDIKNDPQLASGPLNTLANKGLKIDQVINYAFEIISWAH